MEHAPYTLVPYTSVKGEPLTLYFEGEEAWLRLSDAEELVGEHLGASLAAEDLKGESEPLVRWKAVKAVFIESKPEEATQLERWLALVMQDDYVHFQEVVCRMLNEKL